MDAEPLAFGVGEQHVPVAALRFPQPGFQHGAGSFGQGCAAFFAALSNHAHVRTGPKDEVRTFESGHFG